MPIEKPNKVNPKTSKKRRSEQETDIAILAATEEIQNENNGTSKLTLVQGRVIISWNALKKHLADLEKKGFIENGEPRLTKRGQEFLKKYRQEVRPVFDEFDL